MIECKRRSTNLTWRKVLKGAAWILSSLCLTAYVNVFLHLNSFWAYLLLFMGFFSAYGVLLVLAGHFFKSAPDPQLAFLAVSASVLILVQYSEVFFPPYCDKTLISLSAETAGEICLCDVIADGETIPIYRVDVVENSGWQYREEYDNFVIWPEKDGVENRLTMRFFAEEIHLGFPCTPYAGSVTIESSNGYGNTFDLHADTVKFSDFSIGGLSGVYMPLSLLLHGIGILPAISLVCLLLLHSVHLAWKKGQIRNKIFLLLESRKRMKAKQPNLELPNKAVSKDKLAHFGRFAFLPFLLLIWFLLFFTSQRIVPDSFTAMLLLLLTAASYLCMFSDLSRRLLTKYRMRGRRTLLAAIALYASFASFGQRFFLDGNTRMHVLPEGVLYVTLGMIWFLPIICSILFVLEWLASSLRKSGSSPAHRSLAFWALLVILCLCQAVVLRSFWPGGFPADSIDLIQQAAGYGNIKDWHPAINAMLYRIILSLFPRAGALVAVQLFFFALLCAKFLMLGYDYGISFRFLAVLGVAFSLLPNLVIFGISPLKDYPYTLSLLWETYLLVRLAINPEELRKWKFLLALSMALFLIYAFRHNGVVPYAAVLLSFAWITLRHFPQVKLRLAAASLASILMIAAYKGPVFSFFHVSQDVMMSPYTTMLCAAASCVNKGLPLSEKSTAIMESILPIDQWADYYNRYLGHDSYYWGRGELAAEYPFEPAHITAGEAFTVYLEALYKYPDVVIKDRLDGMDILWDVRQPPDSFNTKGFYVTVFSENDQVAQYFGLDPIVPGEHYYNHSSFAEAYRGAMGTGENNVFDMLLWRSGAYLILLMILGVFWWGNRMKGLIWATVPLLGQIAGLVLVLYHQSYRYISSVQILTLALLFSSVCLRNAEAAAGKPEERTEE